MIAEAVIIDNFIKLKRLVTYTVVYFSVLPPTSFIFHQFSEKKKATIECWRIKDVTISSKGMSLS